MLLVTHAADTYCVDRVAESLDRLGVLWRRVDSDRFPTHLRLETRVDAGAVTATLHDGGVAIDLAHVPAVWLRRLWPGVGLAGAEAPAAAFEAARTAFVDTLRLLEGPRFINPVDAEARAESKLLQLREAAACGLETPATVVTNAKDARALLPRSRRVISKLLVPAAVSMGAAPGFVYTHEAPVEAPTLRPQLYQPLLEKVRDWRVIAVGRRLFAASLDASGSPTGHLDWRLVQPEDGLHWEPETVPLPLRRALHRLMDRLGLTYGAIDLLELPKKRLVFLEVNPAGEYGWLERDLGLPISHALAQELAR